MLKREGVVFYLHSSQNSVNSKIVIAPACLFISSPFFIRIIGIVLKDNLTYLNKDKHCTLLDTQVLLKSLKEQVPITRLQKAMGHSSINISLTYLRGLEIAELVEEDMPMLNLF
ncbi:hypothetical protein N9726_01785 [Flavobacteriaceae bacterium]|nr:hypothetical protein [Flavobacteriaceae bacterium]